MTTIAFAATPPTRRHSAESTQAAFRQSWALARRHPARRLDAIPSPTHAPSSRPPASSAKFRLLAVAASLLFLALPLPAARGEPAPATTQDSDDLLPGVAALRDPALEAELVALEDARATDLGRPIALLAHASPSIRARAALTLGRIGHPWLVGALARALATEPVDAVRARECFALGLIGQATAIKPVAAALASDPSLEVRARAAQALGLIGSPLALDPLLAMLPSPGVAPDQARTAFLGHLVVALARLGDRRATAPLTALLVQGGDGHSTGAGVLGVRRAAAWALARLGDPAAGRALTVALDDGDGLVRTFAARGVARCKVEPARGRLESLLADPVPGVRVAAIRALAELAPPGSPVDTRVGSQSARRDARWAAAPAPLPEAGPSARDIARTAAALAAIAFGNGPEPLRVEAIAALGKQPTAGWLDRLRALSREESAMGCAAVVAQARLGAGPDDWINPPPECRTIQRGLAIVQALALSHDDRARPCLLSLAMGRMEVPHTGAVRPERGRAPAEAAMDLEEWLGGCRRKPKNAGTSCSDSLQSGGWSPESGGRTDAGSAPGAESGRILPPDSSLRTPAWSLSEQDFRRSSPFSDRLQGEAEGKGGHEAPALARRILRAAAVGALAESDAPPPVAFWTLLLAQVDPVLRGGAVDGLLKAGKEAAIPRAMRTYTQWQDEDSDDFKSSLVDALATLGAPARGALERLLGDRSRNVRIAAAKAIAAQRRDALGASPGPGAKVWASPASGVHTTDRSSTPAGPPRAGGPPLDGVAPPGALSSVYAPLAPHRPPSFYRDAVAAGERPMTATVVTTRGTFVIRLLPALAPLTVASFVGLAQRGFFAGQAIPRVVPDFVVQMGDPRGDLNGGPGYSLRCEVSEAPYVRGTVGMALAGKDTGGSQFFVTHSPQPHLEGIYTVFGRVESGMDVLDRVIVGDRIQRVTIVSGNRAHP